jgi:hypothetical protein
MQGSNEQHSIEQDIRELKGLSDLPEAVHRMGDHLLALHQRVEHLERAKHEWSARGWQPPEGTEPAPGAEEPGGPI